MTRILVLYASTHGHTGKIDTDEARAASQAYIDQALEATGWRPRLVRAFAGALQYREYDLFTRLLIKLMMKRGGHPTDTSRDHDFTDWAGVERFGAERAALGAVTAT